MNKILEGINLIPVDLISKSSNLISGVSAIGYGPDNETLLVEYKNGRIYKFLEVPKAIVIELITVIGIKRDELIKNRIRCNFEYKLISHNWYGGNIIWKICFGILIVTIMR